MRLSWTSEFTSLRNDGFVSPFMTGSPLMSVFDGKADFGDCRCVCERDRADLPDGDGVTACRGKENTADECWLARRSRLIFVLQKFDKGRCC